MKITCQSSCPLELVLPASFFPSSDIMYACQVKDSEARFGDSPTLWMKHTASIFRVKEEVKEETSRSM